LRPAKKVNTALDNPTNFFAAQNHTQRASDLTARKDGMAEAIQGVKAADKGITGVTSLIEAAKGLIQSARSADAAGRENLAAQFNTIRTQISQLASDSTYKGKNFLNGDTLNVLFNENGGSYLTIQGFDSSASGLTITNVTLAVAESSATGVSTVGTGTTFVSSVATISSLTLTGAGTVADTTHTATLSTNQAANFVAAQTGFYSPITGAAATGVTLDLTTGNGKVFGAGTTGLDQLATGLVTIAFVVVNGQQTSGVAILSGASGVYAINLSGLSYSGGALIGSGISGATVSIAFSIAAHTTSGADATGLANMTVFDLMAGDNASGAQNVSGGPNVYVSGLYVAQSGNYTISSGASGAIITFTNGLVPLQSAGAVTYSYNSGAGDATAKDVIVSGGTAGIKFFVSGTQLSGGQYTVGASGVSFNTGVLVTGQVLTVTVDSGTYGSAIYSGATVATVSSSNIAITGTNQSTFNLVSGALAANQAVTAVYVSGTAVAAGTYTVNTGVGSITFTTGIPALGQVVTTQITTTTAAVTGAWSTDSGLDTSLAQLEAGLSTLRTQSAALASNLNVVATRQDFTDNMVNTLLKGADNLTLADMNEEGANMLMLQTRQQLSTTSLKMASDAAQAVLRLF